MRKNIKLAASLVTGAVAAIPSIAFAQTTGTLAGNGITIAKMSENLVASIQGASTVVTAAAYLGAVTFGFIGALKWKEHGNQPDRTTMKVPMTYWGISAVCAALPEFIGTGIASLWGSNTKLVTAAGGGL